MNLDLAYASTALRIAMVNDPEIAWSWLCNIACPIRDEIPTVTHEQSNRAAERIMQHLFGVSLVKLPQWQEFERAWKADPGTAARPIDEGAKYDESVDKMIRDSREEAFRAGYRHALGVMHAGVPTEDFERDVAAYMANKTRTVGMSPALGMGYGTRPRTAADDKAERIKMLRHRLAALAAPADMTAFLSAILSELENG